MSELSLIERRLSQVRRSIRTLFVLDGTARLLLAVCGFAGTTFLLDWLLALPAAVRLAFLVSGIAFFAWTAFRRLIYPLRRSITDEDLAILIERRYPELGDRLISAIQLSRKREDKESELVRVLVADAVQATEPLEFNRVLEPRHVRKAAGWGLVVILLVLGISYHWSLGKSSSPLQWMHERTFLCSTPYQGGSFCPLISVYLKRLFGADARWPQRTYLDVDGFSDRRRIIARGDDLTVIVQARGVIPGRVLLSYEYGSGERGRERLSPLAGDRFTFTFARVTGPFTFAVSGGDAQTEVMSVETMNPPNVDRVEIFYRFPRYMGLTDTPPDRPETTGNVLAPIFTEVRFVGYCNEDIGEAILVEGRKDPHRKLSMSIRKNDRGEPRIIGALFDVREEYSEYALHVTGTNGLENREPLRYTIKGIKDRDPQIILKDPQSDESVAELCVRPISVETRDDFGIESIAFVTKIVGPSEAAETAVPFTRDQNDQDYGERLIRSAYDFDFSKLNVKPGDAIDFRIESADYKDIGGRNVGRTKTYRFTIVSQSELEKQLEAEIDKIKQALQGQKRRQELQSEATDRLEKKFGAKEDLSSEEKGEIKGSALEQNSIQSNLDSRRREIERVMRRGVYNRIFDEPSAAKLKTAADVLTDLVGDPNDPRRPATAAVASRRLMEAATARGALARSGLLREAQERQSEVLKGISLALDLLERWASYQEVVRLTREALEMRQGAMEGLRKAWTCDSCKIRILEDRCPRCGRTRK